MLHAKRALVASALALACLLPSQASAAGSYVKTSTAIGNSTTIIVNGGVVVQSSNSCSTGVTGFLYQSIRIIFGGSVIVNTTQSTTCP